MMIQNENGSFTYIDTRDHRPEPTEAELAAARAHNTMFTRQVMSEFKWTPEDLSLAKKLGLPGGGEDMVTAGAHKGQGIYLRDQIDEWRDRIKAMAKRLR